MFSHESLSRLACHHPPLGNCRAEGRTRPFPFLRVLTPRSLRLEAEGTRKPGPWPQTGERSSESGPNVAERSCVVNGFDGTFRRRSGNVTRACRHSARIPAPSHWPGLGRLDGTRAPAREKAIDFTRGGFYAKGRPVEPSRSPGAEPGNGAAQRAADTATRRWPRQPVATEGSKGDT